MKTFIFLIGFCITLPIITVEALLKIAIIVLLCPTILVIAIIYPLIKRTKVLEYIDKLIKYSFTWKKGFYSSRITYYWI